MDPVVKTKPRKEDTVPMERMRLPAEAPSHRIVNPQAVLVPTCTLCSQKIELLEDAVMILSGQWMPNRELGEPIFVLDTDVPLKFVQMPNGQYALMVDGEANLAELVQHMHVDCIERIKMEVHGFTDYDDESYFDENGDRF
jgi:hypothetical protein